ncbi:MAG: hypothetical protein M3377_07645 [Actinomycetota bacterium]|nr:hypothetical protein [Actinomycetota bacterium]
MGRPKDRDALRQDGETNRANRIQPDRPGVEVSAFDKKVRIFSAPSEITDLSPESSSFERKVKIGDRFPLHQRAASDLVVTNLEARQDYVDA